MIRQCNRTGIHLAVAPWFIAAVLSALLFASCHGPNTPETVVAPAGPVGLHAAIPLRAVAGPSITLTNEYMDPVTSGSGATLRIPDGVPLTFCWTAAPASDGVPISAYRYGWDIFDPGDPNAWETDFVPFDGSEVCAPTRAFESGFHIFAVEVMDEDDRRSRIQVPVILTFGPSSYDVMPGSCQNRFNVRRKGRIRTAIPGRIGMDIGEIDVSSLQLWIDGNVVEPLETRVRDVTGALIPAADCGCPAAGPDGHDDLLVFFDAAEISRALGPVSNGEERRLVIRGTLTDGYEFSPSDCITIAGNPPGDDKPALFFRDAVLEALKRAYKESDYSLVEALLDDDFTFYFADEDVQSGDVAFEKWDRDHELAATAALFEGAAPSDGSLPVEPARTALDVEYGTWGRLKAGSYDGTYHGVTFFLVELSYTRGDDAWITVPASDPRYAGEVWYEKDVGCTVFAQMESGTYLAFPYWGTFIVRYSVEDGRWRLIEWRDGTQLSTPARHHTPRP